MKHTLIFSRITSTDAVDK